MFSDKVGWKSLEEALKKHPNSKMWSQEEAVK